MSHCCTGILIAGLLVSASGAVRAGQPAKKPAGSKPGSSAASDAVLVVVNGEKITEADLNRTFAYFNVPEEERPGVRKTFVDNLIDTRLIQQFLKSRKTVATKQAVDEQIKLFKNQLKQAGLDPDKALDEKGFTTELLREMFAVPLAWQRHIDRAVTPERLKKYFEEHRAEFDGTRVQARQILIRARPGDDEAREAAESRLSDLRQQILAKKISFEDAAREHSEAPSKEQGGDVGLFPFTGKMPQEFSREAFKLKIGEISLPFRSRFGVHLCLVTDRKPGDASLEDVREEVLARLRDEMWKETAAQLRGTAKIEWKIEKP
jgi:parvulin-like peptidyl-prolyl isomerase